MFSLFKKKAQPTELESLVRTKTDEEIRVLVLGQMLFLRNALAGYGKYEAVPVRTADLTWRKSTIDDLLTAMETALLSVQRRTVYDRAMEAAVTEAAKLAAGTTVAAQEGGATEQLKANAHSEEDKGTMHWVTQGLNKLGYSMPEARSVAQQHFRPGMTLEQGIQACLQGRGRLK